MAGVLVGVGRMFLTLSLVALALPVVSQADAKRGRACDPRHSYTLEANRQVRVYAVVERYGPHVVWACERQTGRRFRLGAFDPHDPDFPNHVLVRLSGRLVGSLSSFYDHYGNTDFLVVVRDVSSGAVLHRAHKEGNDMYGETGWSPSKLVMDRAGSVAWTAWGFTTGTVTGYVFKSDTTRWGEMLASGPDIDPKSLRRGGRTLTWNDGGAEQTARFAR
jgi:hypothetical protein